MQAIFQLEFQERSIDDLFHFDWIDYSVPDDERLFAINLIKGVLENSEIINKTIVQYSKNWDISRISRVSKAILQLSIFQMMDPKDHTPHKVIIDEAVRLSKKYAEEDAGRFINGILDTYHKHITKSE